MEHWALVTGASRGIGKAIVWELRRTYPDMPILATARNIESQNEFNSDMITLLNADVSTEEGVLMIVSAMEGKQVMYLFNNAGYLPTPE